MFELYEGFIGNDLGGDAWAQNDNRPSYEKRIDAPDELLDNTVLDESISLEIVSDFKNVQGLRFTTTTKFMATYKLHIALDQTVLKDADIREIIRAMKTDDVKQGFELSLVEGDMDIN